MSTRTITAEFDDFDIANSAVGRLEVAGVDPKDITVKRSGVALVTVSAAVEDRLYDKAKLILGAGGQLRS
jgi:HSP20 family molecular chaperone IbpA